jgi:hypothetical protein
LARVEELIAAVAELAIRRELAPEIASLKRRVRFGLVFEVHLPETAHRRAVGPGPRRWAGVVVGLVVA